MEWLDAKDIANRLTLLGLPTERDTLRHWQDRHGDFPEGKKFGRSWAWPWEEVLRWVKTTDRLPQD